MLRSSYIFGRRLLIRTTEQHQQQRRMFLRAPLLPPATPPATSFLSSPHPVLHQQHQYQSPYRAFSSTPISPAAESHEFQAETRQLLDIVIHSVYTDKEVRLDVLFLLLSPRDRCHFSLFITSSLSFPPCAVGFPSRAHLQRLRRARKAPAHPRYSFSSTASPFLLSLPLKHSSHLPSQLIGLILHSYPLSSLHYPDFSSLG